MSERITYGLYIRRYGRSLSFDNIESLRETLKEYFTKKEVASGVVDRLTAFEGKKIRDGLYIRNDYQDFEVYCYPCDEYLAELHNSSPTVDRAKKNCGREER